MTTLLDKQDRSGENSSQGHALLYIEDISDLLGGKKSRWWIRNNFAPNDKLKIGRTLAWPKERALAWIFNQGAHR